MRTLPKPERQKRLQTAQVVLTRINGHEMDWAELHAGFPIAKAYLGDDTEAALEARWQHQT